MTTLRYWLWVFGIGIGLIGGSCAPLVDGSAESQGSSTVVGNPSKGFSLNLTQLHARYSGGEVRIQAKKGFVVLGQEFTERDLTIALAKADTTKALFTKKDFDRSKNDLVNTTIPAQADEDLFLTVYVTHASNGRERVQVVFENGVPNIKRVAPLPEPADNEATYIAARICDRIIDCFGATTREACMEGILATHRLIDNFGIGMDSTVYGDVVASLEASKVSIAPESYSQCLADIEALDCGTSGAETATIASGYNAEEAHNWFSDTEMFIPKSCSTTFSGETMTESMNVATELMQEMCIRIEKCLGPSGYCEDELTMLSGLAHEFGIPVNTAQGMKPDLPMDYLVTGIGNGFVLANTTAYETCFHEIGGIQCDAMQNAYKRDSSTYSELIALIPDASMSCGGAFANNIESGMLPGSSYCFIADAKKDNFHCVELTLEKEVKEYYSDMGTTVACTDDGTCGTSSDPGSTQ